jgi:hypothetical protein
LVEEECWWREDGGGGKELFGKLLSCEKLFRLKIDEKLRKSFGNFIVRDGRFGASLEAEISAAKARK